MADSRCLRLTSPTSRSNAEGALLDWLNKSKQLIPKKRRDFMDFVYKYVDKKEFPEYVVNTVWVKLKNFEKKIKECPTIVLSSDEEKVAQVTEILDFDVMNSENEPNITVLEVPQPPTKSPEKRKREYQYSRSSNKNKGLYSAEDLALLKKFKRQIILEELLKRDKEMLKIQQKKDKFQTAVQIEMGYAQRIQKERVEMLAQEMLRLHKEGFRADLSSYNLAQYVCLVDPPQMIPSESVIIERLPSPEPNYDVLCEDLPSDHINYEMLYPSEEPTVSNDSNTTNRRGSKRHSDPLKVKQAKRKANNSKNINNAEAGASSKKSKRKIEADILRQKLYIDTLIEMTLPEVVEEVNAAKRLRQVSSGISC